MPRHALSCPALPCPALLRRSAASRGCTRLLPCRLRLRAGDRRRGSVRDLNYDAMRIKIALVRDA